MSKSTASGRPVHKDCIKVHLLSATATKKQQQEQTHFAGLCRVAGKTGNRIWKFEATLFLPATEILVTGNTFCCRKEK